MLDGATERFNRIKRYISMEALTTESWSIPCKGIDNNPTLGVRNHCMTLKPEDVHLIFEPIILSVIKLINEQIAATGVPIHGILLLVVSAKTST